MTNGVTFPDELSVAISREFKAPIDLVWAVLTEPEHVRKTFAPFDEEVTVCEIDLRVGGNYHYVMVTTDGTECSFRGTYLEVQPPTRTVETWLFDGWPNAHAVETMELHESGGTTTLTVTIAFRDKAGRDHMTKYDGLESNLDNLETYIGSLVNL